MIDIYNKVYTTLQNQNFTLLHYTEKRPYGSFSIHIEVLNYLIYQWNVENNRSNEMFKYIFKPNELVVLNNVTIKEFMDFLIKCKDSKKEIMFIEPPKQQQLF
jgi:hypothetical protein